MMKFAYSIGAFIVLVAIVVTGCRPDEIVKPKPAAPKTEQETMAVISVGMDTTTANAILSRSNLVTVEEDSGMAMAGAPASRRLRVGVNPNGDALFLTATSLPSGSEEITDMFWHRGWVSEMEKPKSERKDDVKDVDSVDVKDAKLKTFIPGHAANRIDRDPFGR